MHRWGWLLLGVLACPACVKQAATAPPVEQVTPRGWTTIGGHPCYAPPDFQAADGMGERRALRGEALTEATKRWRGNIDPAFSLPEDLVDDLETALLTAPDRIEAFLAQDFEQCSAWAAGQLSIDAYRGWHQQALAAFVKDDCGHPPFELITQYLEVNQRWQVEIPLCRDEQVQIDASAGMYTIEDKGADDTTRWIDVEGDRQQPADSSLPCHVPGTYRGQLVGRFLDRDGRETCFPVNRQAFFAAPAHGTLAFSVNDTQLFDNRFRTVDRVTDYLLIEIRPARASAVSP